MRGRPGAGDEAGDLAGAKIVHIDRMQVNVQVHHGSGNAIQFSLDDIKKLPKEMQDALMKMKPEPKSYAGHG